MRDNLARAIDKSLETRPMRRWRWSLPLVFIITPRKGCLRPEVIRLRAWP
jgi:hypothetical protein